MKKIILIGGGIVVVVFVAVLVGVFLSLNSIVKKGVETVGPMVTKVDVKLGSADISAFSGSGKLNDFYVGNPEGFTSPFAMKVGSVALGVQPKSVMSDVVVINEIKVQNAEITLEGNLSKNNLTTILQNVKDFSGTNAAPTTASKSAAPGSKKKIIVNDFLIDGAKINLVLTLPVIGTKTLNVPLPTIHLQDIGKSEGGITPDQLIQVVTKEILSKATTAATDAIAQLGGGLKNMGTDLGKNLQGVGNGAVDGVGNAAKGITDLFKKK